jgi:Alginate export
MRLSACWWVGAFAVALVVAAGRVAGAIELLERDGLSLGFEFDAGVGGLLTENTNFGVGRIDLRGGEVSGDAQWGEGYLKPSLSLDYDIPSAGVLYGGVSGVGTLTVGDGDAGGFTDGGDKKVSLETLYGGWRSGALLTESLGEDALDLSAGRQDFHVGDGFLIWDGNFDTRGDGAYWLGPRTAFEFGGLARVNTSPLGGQFFFLRADGDQGHTELTGANLDYGLSDFNLGDDGVLGAMYFQVTDVDTQFQAETPREDMQLATIRLNDVRVPGFEDAGVYAQYAREFGNGNNVDFDAQAFYVEPFYNFSWLPWSPTLAYRFAYFSGDPDPDDDERKDFDPFFYDYSRSWGTWTQGEIVGQYLLFNSNQVNHMVHLSATPVEPVTVGALYYHFDLAERNYFGTPVDDKDFADELDMYVDWTVNDNLLIGALSGVAWPGQAAEELFGDEPFYLLLAYAIITF